MSEGRAAGASGGCRSTSSDGRERQRRRASDLLPTPTDPSLATPYPPRHSPPGPVPASSPISRLLVRPTSVSLASSLEVLQLRPSAHARAVSPSPAQLDILRPEPSDGSSPPQLQPPSPLTGAPRPDELLRVVLVVPERAKDEVGPGELPPSGAGLNPSSSNTTTRPGLTPLPPSVPSVPGPAQARDPRRRCVCRRTLALWLSSRAGAGWDKI